MGEGTKRTQPKSSKRKKKVENIYLWLVNSGCNEFNQLNIIDVRTTPK